MHEENRMEGYDLYTQYNSFPLFWAIEHSEALAIRLINLGVNITEKIDGYTALHKAVMYGKDKVVQLLLSRGANASVHSKDRENYSFQPSRYNGLTPLHIAVDNDLIRIANMLLHAGASLHTIALNTEEIGFISSLELARKKSNPNMINLLKIPPKIRLGNQMIAFGQAIYQLGFLGKSVNTEILTNLFFTHFPAGPNVSLFEVKRLARRLFTKIIDLYSRMELKISFWKEPRWPYLAEWQLWNSLHIQYLIENRHECSLLQHEYDKRFGLELFQPN
jgi:hypothetical protein